MPPPGKTIAASPTYDVSLPADQIAGMKILHIGSDFDNLSTEFVPDRQRHTNRGLRPFVPIVNVEVGAANSRAKHANFDVIDAGLRLGDIFEPEPWLGATFNECFHSRYPLARSIGRDGHGQMN